MTDFERTVSEMAIVLADGTVIDAPLHNALLDNPEAEKLALAAAIAEELGCPDLAKLILEGA